MQCIFMMHIHIFHVVHKKRISLIWLIVSLPRFDLDSNFIEFPHLKTIDLLIHQTQFCISFFFSVLKKKETRHCLIGHNQPYSRQRLCFGTPFNQIRNQLISNCFRKFTSTQARSPTSSCFIARLRTLLALNKVHKRITTKPNGDIIDGVSRLEVEKKKYIIPNAKCK